MINFIHIFFIFFALAILGHFLYSIWKIKRSLHILQLNSYYNRRYLTWLIKKKSSLIQLRDLEPLIALVGLFFNRPLIVLIFTATIYGKLLLEIPKTTEKKPLIFTARASRLFITNIVFLLILYGCLLHFLITNGSLLFGLSLGTLVVYNVLQPLLFIVTNWLLTPLEQIIQKVYLKNGASYLKSLETLKVIGITGSFGKTTTKYIVTELLKRRFNALKTPQSYNTLMGVTKIIRSDLKPIHEFFVVEMSAKQPGDIKKICDLVKPQYGMITAIGEQHLETFKNLDAIKKTKNELIESLPPSGTAFFNADDLLCRELATAARCRIITYGIDSTVADYRAMGIVTDEMGSKFTVLKYGSVTPVRFTTSLLGKHNIYNILGAIAVASELRIELNEMIYPISQLAAVPHRLALRKIHDNIVIIDDAFNANPVGSNIALEVLAQFTARRKIILTPGMIELGIKERQYNYEFGEHIAKVCDYVILVGKQQTLPIQEAVAQKNYPLSQLFVAQDFLMAKQHLEKILQPGDVVLFENDLPDNYNE